MPHPEPLVVAYLHQESTQETENHAVNHSHAEAPKQYKPVHRYMYHLLEVFLGDR